MARLAWLVTVNTAELTTEETVPENRLAQTIHQVSPETVATWSAAERGNALIARLAHSISHARSYTPAGWH
jgi:hypothetical protein